MPTPPHTNQSRHVLQSQGNGTCKLRRRSDMSAAADYPPRGGLISTGEDSIGQQSALARNLTIEFTPDTHPETDVNDGSIDLRLLTELQADAKDKLYAQAMSSYILHLSADYPRFYATGTTKGRIQAAGNPGEIRRPRQIQRNRCRNNSRLQAVHRLGCKHNRHNPNRRRDRCSRSLEMAAHLSGPASGTSHIRRRRTIHRITQLSTNIRSRLHS